MDHSTDTFDHDRLAGENIPETNGKVGILGISYDASSLMALVIRTRAEGVGADETDGGRLDGGRLVPQRRVPAAMMPYMLEQVATRDNTQRWCRATSTTRPVMSAGSAGELDVSAGLEQIGFWHKIIENPAYNAFWREQAMDKVLGARPLSVPVMIVHSLWDQEDIYGAIRRLQGARAEGHRERQGVPRHGAVASRTGDRRGEYARRAQVQQRHGAPFPARGSWGLFSRAPEGRRAEDGTWARDGVRNGYERVAAADQWPPSR